jgi:protein phosphatase
VIGFDQIDYASATDPGIRRSQNEDSHAVSVAVEPEQWQRQGHIFLVADGMGGHAVGELASELAANLIPHTYHKYASEGPAAALRKAFLEANAGIHARGQQNLDFKGMGTTSTVLVLRPAEAWIAHVGDSRAYRIRDNRIEQLTFDHSWVWELARRQKVDPDSLKGVASNFINRSLGPDPLVQIDIEGPHALAPGDTFVLCSDGLSNQVSDTEIGAIVQALPPAEACPLLMQLANVRGGPDNITVLVIHISGNASASAPDTSSPPAPKQPERFPWSHWSLAGLLLGVALATAAVALNASQASAWSVPTFGLAALFVFAGLAGLAWRSWRDRGAPAEAAPETSLRVYRQVSCQIDKPLVDRLAYAEANLGECARGKAVRVDWATNQRQRELAQAALQRGDLAAAFQAYCRAIRPITECLWKDRFKDEGLHLGWEKTLP